MRIGFLLIAITPMFAGCGIFGSGDRPAERDSSHPLPAPALETRQCLAALDQADIEYRRLPDRSFNGGCSAIGAVQLLQVGTPTNNLGAMTCPLAERYGRWTREILQPAAQRYFDKQVVLVETMGTYSCRNIAGSSRISEHAKANAVDVSGFRLEDGRRITVLDGWNSDDRRTREFLRELHDGGCREFAIVLGPDANADHRNHFHFDMGDNGPYCR